MTKQFIRECRLTLVGASSVIIPGGGSKDLQIQASIGASTLQMPSPALFIITNPNHQTVTAFKNKEFQSVTFEAGYQGNCGPLYSGQIKQSLYLHADDNVTSYMRIYCAEHANPYQQARVNATLAAGWTPRDKLNLALQAMKPLGITDLGLCNVDLDTPKYPRARPFASMARDLLREVAMSKGATWSMHNGKINVINPSMPVQASDPIILNSNTGLIGGVQQTESGIIARCLINPAISINSTVKIDEASINQGERIISLDSGFGAIGPRNFNLDNTGRLAADGLYRVAYFEVEADTRDQPWSMVLTCLAADASLNGNQLAAGLGVGLT